MDLKKWGQQQKRNIKNKWENIVPVKKGGWRSKKKKKVKNHKLKLFWTVYKNNSEVIKFYRVNITVFNQIISSRQDT